jgi:hypothetical protein
LNAWRRRYDRDAMWPHGPSRPRANGKFVPTHCVVHRTGLRPIRRIQAMTFSKLALGASVAAFAFCVGAIFSPSTGPLLADGSVALRSFQSGSVSGLEAGTVSALPSPDLDRTVNSMATDRFSNNRSSRRLQAVVQACKPPGAACSLPGECCSNSCVPPGFGGQPTCQ